jgi:glycolate oxidase FAD binding subunit
MITHDGLTQRLQATLGSSAVTADPAVLDAHRIDGVRAHVVLIPDSAGQINAALRLCSEAKATVIPWGGGTAMSVGNRPRRADVIMNLSKVARVIDHDPANLTVSAQCGMTLSDLRTALASERQTLPIDAPLPARATLGGTVAASINGPRRACYGSVRDLVTGMKVVLVNGESIKAGGKVVKNVAGYDLCKLFVGSLGTLGIISEVTLRLAPACESAATIIGNGSLAEARRFVEELWPSSLLPAAVCLLKDAEQRHWRVAIWCEGFTESVERHLGDLGSMATASGMTCHVLRAANHDDFWQKLSDASAEPNRVVYRVILPRAELFDFIARSQDWRADTVGDFASGTVWLSLPAMKSSIARFREIESMARHRRGHAVLFAAPASLKGAVNVWGPSPATLPLMRDIKRQFDPDELLNPGRFIGSL